MRRIRNPGSFVKRALLVFLLVMVSFGLVACEAWPGLLGRPAHGEIAQSDKPRLTSPDVAPADLAELVGGNGRFAFDLYQALRDENGNLFYSPYSISVALAMTHAGARGETEKQIAETLHFVLDQEDLHPVFNSLDLELATRSQTKKESEGEPFKLKIANSLWGQTGYSFLQEFLDLLAENYGAGFRLLDFARQPEQSRTTINDWVSDQTEGKIRDLIPQGVIDALTRLVLANAIYFNASWSEPFSESLTDEGTFHLLDGGQVSVPMMEQTKSFPYAEGNGYQAVQLPYVGGKVAMVVLLPKSGEFEAFEESLSSELIDSILSDVKRRNIALIMPKFEFESSFHLRDTLAGMGMPDAFSGEADFSGIDGTRSLFIDDVLHKAFVSVDEAGTEAAAATAVVIKLTAAVQRPLQVTVDRPFVFLIRDIETGTTLFVGRVLDPS